MSFVLDDTLRCGDVGLPPTRCVRGRKGLLVYPSLTPNEVVVLRDHTESAVDSIRGFECASEQTWIDVFVYFALTITLVSTVFLFVVFQT